MTLARAIGGIVVTAVVGLGCGKKDDTTGQRPAPPPTSATPTVPGEASAASTASDASVAVAKPVTPAQPSKAVRRDFRGRMQQGRALEKNGNWAEAMAEFEAALALWPNNTRALSELGWVAFKAGQLDRSIEASRASVLDETDPRVAGASLYNLGRALEAKQQAVRALSAYRESLARRPNQTVLDRYLKLGGRLDPWATAPACGAAPTPATALCECFRQRNADPDEPEHETSCEIGQEVGGLLSYTVQRVHTGRDRGGFTTFVGRRTSAGIQLAGGIGDGVIGPKNWESVELAGVQQRTVGARTVRELAVSHTVADEEFMTFVGETVTQARVFVVEQGDILRSTEPFAMESTWTMKIGGEHLDDPETAEWFVKEFGGKPPVTWTYRMKVELSADGQVVVGALAGIKKYRAVYQLW